MNAPQHTTGPWSIIPAREYDGDDDALNGSYTSPASIEGADGSPVCEFGTSEGSGCLYENEADYRLIAAAPELFALAHQYRNDLLYPIAGNSRVRRLAAIDAVLAKVMAA